VESRYESNRSSTLPSIGARVEINEAANTSPHDTFWSVHLSFGSVRVCDIKGEKEVELEPYMNREFDTTHF